MNRQIKHITAWLMIVILILVQPFPHFSVKASETSLADTAETIHIASLKDLEKLSENCVSDIWSQDKIVILDKDIDLNDTDFTPIPTFGGVFFGQNHTIRGLDLEGGSDNTGLFRYIQESGEIRDLNLYGSAAADSTHSGLALLAGCNRGLISNCHADGNVAGGDDVGLLAGINEITGVIENGYAQGSVYGNHRAGGISGTNKGSILNGVNKCSVNTVTAKNDINISALTISDLLTTENITSVTDIGGIAGSSSGIIRACVNSGSIGYQHVGYNIGGIAGSQTGYIEGCVNYGVLNGRKDVGGIAGQMEPSSEIEYLEDTLDKLNEEFNKLHGLVRKMTDDAGGTSDKLTARMDHLLTSVENTQNVISDITNQTSADMDSFSIRLTDISSLPQPDYISLDFLDEIPKPSAAPTPTLTPTPTPDTTVSGNTLNPGTSGSYTNIPRMAPPTTIIPQTLYEPDPVVVPEDGPDSGPGEDTGTDPDPGEDPVDAPGSEEDPDTDPDPSPTPEWMEDFKDKLENLPEYDFDKDKAENEINRVQDSVYEDAQKILDDMKNTFSNEASVISSRLNAHHTALNSSFSDIISDMRLLNNMLNDESNLLLSDFQAISDEINVITNIITAPDTADPDDLITDVSDADKETDITGKIMNCVNKGKIYGDLNAGGIAGAMSRENTFDPEDDLNLSDDSSLNIRYKERIVIRQSQNSGVITGKKNCAGGIAGYMTLGSIIDCIGNGDVESDGSMIGGIAGQSEGTIRGSSAKCALSGKDQLGGIAGYGSSIFNCYSMVEIKKGENYIGSIAGKAELSDKISNNFFVKGCPAGIDGVSYAGIAEPVSYGEFLCLEGLPDIYKNIYLTFMADDKIVSTVTLSYGESFDVNTLPAVPFKEGYSGTWEDFDASSLTFDQTIDAVYSEYFTTLESSGQDNMRPVALVEGTFKAGDRFTLLNVDAYPEDGKTKAVCQKISIIGGTHPYTVRYLIPEGMENPQIELFENNSWIPVSSYIDGSYCVFTVDKPEIVFSCVDRPESSVRQTILIISVTALVLLILIIAVRRRKRNKKAS